MTGRVFREVDGDNDGLSDVISVTETLYHRIGLGMDIELSTNYMFCQFSSVGRTLDL